MVKLTWLKVGKYRIVEPGTELHFNDSYNILLGKNGTGKTTLLNLIAMILSSSFAGLEEEEFDLQYKLAVPRGELHVRVRNVRDEEGRRRRRSLDWTFDLGFEPAAAEGRAFQVRANRYAARVITRGQAVTTPISANVSPFKSGQSFLRAITVSPDEFGGLETAEPLALFSIGACQRFDESVDWLSHSVERAEASWYVMDAGSLGTEEIVRLPAEVEQALSLHLADGQRQGSTARADHVSFQSGELRFLADAARALDIKKSPFTLN